MVLTRKEAAAALGVSVDSFERHFMPHLRCVRKGSLRLYAVRELERFLEDNASRPPAA